MIYNTGAIFENSAPEVGFAIVRDLLTHEGVELFRRALEELLSSVDQSWLLRNSASTLDGRLIVVRSIDTPSDFFFTAARDRIIVTLAEKYANMRITPLYVEYFDKPPHSNIHTPPHQDHAFYNEHFPDELGLTFWVALDDCDEQNGCMFVEPTMRRTLRPHERTSELGFGFKLSDPDLSKFVPIRLRAGDALLHGSFTPHYCPGNDGPRDRRAIAISFRTSEIRQSLCAPKS